MWLLGLVAALACAAALLALVALDEWVDRRDDRPPHWEPPSRLDDMDRPRGKK